MMTHTVQITTDAGLCCSCGICKNACPRSCIRYQRRDGLYVPVIDRQACIECGICYDLCPGIRHGYTEPDPIRAMTGDCLGAYNAWSRDEDLRFVSASGGCVSSLVLELLRNQEYDYAATLDTYDYHDQLRSTLISAENATAAYSGTAYPKSRYLPVSHEEIVAFALAHKDKKIIFIGTSCAVRGFLNVIDRFRLNRDHYLLIGLFCDKVFNYNIFDCYRFMAEENDGKTLTDLHFKNKESGGWPGNMKWFFSDGTYRYVDASERMKLKAYFMPERCLYCVDKLNVEADISVGDNFTEEDSTALGSNSVLIRTKRGEKAWNAAQSLLVSKAVSADAIARAQGLDSRAEQAYYARIKEKRFDLPPLNDGVAVSEPAKAIRQKYQIAGRKAALGRAFDQNPRESLLKIRRMQQAEHKTTLRQFLGRCYRKLTRSSAK